MAAPSWRAPGCRVRHGACGGLASRGAPRGAFSRAPGGAAAAFPSHWSLPKDEAPRLWYVENEAMSAGSSGSWAPCPSARCPVSRRTSVRRGLRPRGRPHQARLARAAQDSSNWPSPPLSSQKFLNVRPKNQPCAPFRSSAKPADGASRRAVAASSRTSACVPLSSACCCFSF